MHAVISSGQPASGRQQRLAHAQVMNARYLRWLLLELDWRNASFIRTDDLLRQEAVFSGKEGWWRHARLHTTTAGIQTFLVPLRELCRKFDGHESGRKKELHFALQLPRTLQSVGREAVETSATSMALDRSNAADVMRLAHGHSPWSSWLRGVPRHKLSFLPQVRSCTEVKDITPNLRSSCTKRDVTNTILELYHLNTSLGIPGLDIGDWPCAPLPLAECSTPATRIAFIMAGQARSFVEPQVYGSYKQHVLEPLAGGEALRLFLYLKDVRPPEVAAAIAALRPDAVRFASSSDSISPLRPHPACVNGKWSRKSYLAKALNWWGAMHASWDMVRAWETERRTKFGRVVFTRPDLRYTRSFGPWCSYRPDTWYTGGIGMPDMFWVLPRTMAARVLTTLDIFLECRPGRSCCVGQQSDTKPWLVSYWILKYWSSMYGFNISTRLLGSAMVPLSTSSTYAHLGCGLPNCGSMLAAEAGQTGDERIAQIRSSQSCGDD